MVDHPAQPRIAEVLVTQAGEARRGSGYLVAPGWVLTAGHVVADAQAVAVWLGVPPILQPDSGVGVDPRRILLAEDADLALLPVDQPSAEMVEPVLLGQLDRTAGDPVPVAAAGCPRFKVRPAPGRPGVELRELHVATGTIAARSDAKTGTLELAVQVVPAEDPQPKEHSPWEGMSGAAVWASGRLVGVVGQHHPRQGSGVLTVRPVAGLFESVTAEDLAAWQHALPQLGATAEDLSLATLPSARELVDWWAHQEAAELLPKVLVARDEELADLTAFVGSQARWRWVQGAAFAGKTALLAWFALHPPEGVDVVACFLRRTASRADAGYALSVLTAQLARLADRPDDRPTAPLHERVRYFRMLLEDAAQACQQRGRRLLVLVDGLDEDQTIERGFAVARWLPDAMTLLDNLWLLVASRAGVQVPLPDGHPLTAHVDRLTVSMAASEIQALAQAELADARSNAGDLVYDVLGLLAASFGGLTITDLTELIHRHGQPWVSSVQVSDVLDRSLARSVLAVSDQEGHREADRVFAHDALLEQARTLYARDLLDYQGLLDTWADQYQQSGWPPTTPLYLLRSYGRMLGTTGNLDRLVDFATDVARQDCMLTYAYSDAAALAEITTAQQLLRDRDIPNLGALGRLAAYRDRLANRNRNLPPDLPAVWARLGQSQRAEALARSIPSLQSRAAALTALADTLARVGQWDRAEQTARANVSPYAKASALALIAKRMVRTDQARATTLLIDAEQTARTISDPERKVGSISAVARVLARIDRERAVALAAESEEIASPLSWIWKDWAIVNVVRVLAAAEHWTAAEQTIAKIKQPEMQASARRVLAKALVDAGLWVRAERTARDFSDLYARAKFRDQVAEPQAQALAEVAEVLAAVHLDVAVTLATEAEVVANTIQNDFDRQAEAFCAVTRAWAAAGSWDHAKRIPPLIGDPEIKIRAFTAVADVLGQSDRHRALDVAIEAEEVSRAFTDPKIQAETLTMVAMTLTEIDRNRVEALAGEIESMAREITDPKVLTETLRLVADALILAEQWDRAEQTACSISDLQVRVETLCRVAEAVASLDQSRAVALTARAERTAHRIIDEYRQANALGALTQALAAAGQWDRAERTARRIADEYRQANALGALTQALAAAGQWDRAEQTAHRITLVDAEAEALCGVAQALAKVDQERAVALAADAERLLDSTGIDSETLSGVLHRLAEAFAATDQWDHAEQLALRISELFGQASGFEAAAEVMAAVGQWDRAERAARSIDDADKQARSLYGMVQALAVAEHWDRAEQIARSITSIKTKISALCALAEALAETDRDRAVVLVANARQAAGSITDTYRKVEPLHGVIHALGATELWNQARQLALSITHPPTQSRMLTALVDQMVASGQWEVAEQTAQGISEPEPKADAYLAIADGLIGAAKLADRPRDESLQVRACRILADVLIDEHWRKAIRSIGKLSPAAVVAIDDTLHSLLALRR